MTGYILYISDRLVVSEEVAAALSSRGPVVALESTIITHGMPYPENLRSVLHQSSVVIHT